MEKGKISSLQMGLMIYPTIIATGILFLPSYMFEYAGRDLWIPPILASVMGALTIFIAYRLHRFYPKETVIQYSCNILGTVLGKILGGILLLFYLHSSSFVIFQYGEFMMGNFLPKTPKIVILGSMIMTCAFAIRGGLEVLGRLAEMIVPILLVALSLIVIFLLPDLEIKHVFPIMGNGIMPSLQATIFLNIWFGQFFYLSFFLPVVTDRTKGRKWVVISLFAVVLTMVVTNLITLLVFGESTGNFEAPLMAAVTYISIADFLSHLESLVMACWIAGAFMKIGVIYYALVLGLAQWLNLSDYRPIVFPVGFLMILMSIWQVPNKWILTSHNQVAPFIDPVMQMGIPLFLLLVAYIRKGKQQNKEEAKG